MQRFLVGPGVVSSVVFCLGLLLSAPSLPAQAGEGASIGQVDAGPGEPGVEPGTRLANEQPSETLLEGLEPPLRQLAAEVLARNPDVARARAEAAAAQQRAPQVKSLPDPMAAVTTFLLTPETRVGPQQVMAGISQRFPWFGKLALRERGALYRAAAVRAEVEAKRLALVTETRRLYYELAFLEEWEQVVRADRATLSHYEELALSRYASGVGLQQSVLKIQAEITKDDNRLLEIANRRASVLAALNALRDLPPGTPPPALELPPFGARPALASQALRRRALAVRPEVARARVLIAAASTGVDLAKKEYRPDVTLGLTYTLVGSRDDAAGRAMPPEGNGDDILGLTVGVNLPVWRRRLAAGVAEASARVSAAEEGLRSVVTGIDQSLGDLEQRIPLTWQQLELFEEILAVQAEEALRSAESAYGAGTVGALDLLDAERVLLEVKTSTARARADYAIAVARLEGAAATPLSAIQSSGETP